MVRAPPGYMIVDRCGFGRAVDLELYGRRTVWYARCDRIGMDDIRRDEKLWDGFAFENSKDPQFDPRPSSSV